MPLVRPAIADELPQVGAALAAAFAHDPVWSWMASPKADWDRRAGAWFATEARLQLEGHGEVLVDDQLRGAAIWAPPGRWRTSPRESLALVVPSVRLFGRNTRRGLRLVSKMEALHPREPEHWYLAILGTDPAHQGHGVGSDLIRAVTDRCDQEGVGAYLESSKQTNVPFYERHGFRVTEELALPDGPTLWLMWRDPQEPGA